MIAARVAMNRAREMLTEIRQSATTWMRGLAAEAEGKNTHSESIQRNMCEVASLVLLCLEATNPYKLTSDQLSSMLLSAMMLQDHCRMTVHRSATSHQRTLLGQAGRVLLILEEGARYQLTKGGLGSGLDNAIEHVWEGFQRDTEWQALDVPHQRWLSCKTAVTSDSVSLNVHFNIWEGVLLVAAKPLGKLPSDLTRHDNYISLLGNVSSSTSNLREITILTICIEIDQRLVSVAPSDLPSFEYQSTKHGKGDPKVRHASLLPSEPSAYI